MLLKSATKVVYKLLLSDQLAAKILATIGGAEFYLVVFELTDFI